MNIEIATQWIAALRSGEFAQGQGQLRQVIDESDNVEYCCLGVLCELHRRAQPAHPLYEWGSGTTGVYLGNDGTLPSEVIEWAGMQDDLGTLPDNAEVRKLPEEHLAALNDSGASFSEIAEVIEKYKEQL